MPHGIANIIVVHRKKAVFGKIKQNLGAVFHDLARRRECRIEEDHLMPDHVHMPVPISRDTRLPRYRLHQGQELDLDRAECRAKGEELHRHKFWAGGYFVSTVGRDEETIRAYIRNQELQDRQMDQLTLIP